MLRPLPVGEMSSSQKASSLTGVGAMALVSPESSPAHGLQCLSAVRGMTPPYCETKPHGAPPDAPAQQQTGRSVVTELHETLTKQLLAKGKSAPQARAAIGTFLEWTQAQGTNSWSYEPRAAKFWHVKQRNITPEANFWASESVDATSEAERSYKGLTDIHGEETIDIVWAAHHACRSSSP